MDRTGDDALFGLEYAVVAYAVLLVAFFAYVAWIHFRCARLAARLQDVERRLQESGRPPRP